MELEDFRREIDRIDGELAELICRRMELSAQIGEHKRGRGLPVRDAERERQLIQALCERHPQHADTLRAVYGTLLALSRAAQGEAEQA